MPQLFTNNAASTLAADLTNVATSLTVATGQGARFPTIAGADYFLATLEKSTGTREIVKVTARTGDVFTIVRAQESTTAAAFATGDLIELRPTAEALTRFESSATSTVTVAKGGTGLTTTPTNGQLLIGNGTGYTLANLTQGSGISISSGSGAITVSSTVTPSISVTDTTGAGTNYLGFTSSTSGSIAGISVTSSKLTFNPSSGLLSVPSVFATGRLHGAPSHGISVISTAITVNQFLTIDALQTPAHYYTSNAGGAFYVNVRANSTTTLDSTLGVGQAVTVKVFVKMGATAYTLDGYQVDGAFVSASFVSDDTTTAALANSIAAFTIMFVKTGSGTYTVFSRRERYA